MIERLESRELLLSGLMNQIDQALDKLRLYNQKGKGYWEEFINLRFESRIVKEQNRKANFQFFEEMDKYY